MDIIEFKNSLSRASKKSKLISDIVALIRQRFPDPALLNSLRMDLQLTEYICNVVKNDLTEHTEVEQENIVIDIIKIIHNMSPDDMGMVRNQICYLKDNSKIKTVKTSKYVFKKTCNWFVKKFS